jgi:hypothetical protein
MSLSKLFLLILVTFNCVFLAFVDSQRWGQTTPKPSMTRSRNTFPTYDSSSDRVGHWGFTPSISSTTQHPSWQTGNNQNKDQNPNPETDYRWNSNIPRIPETTITDNKTEKFISSILSGGKKPSGIGEAISTLNPSVLLPTLSTFLTTLNTCAGEREGWTDSELGDFTVGPESPYCSSSCLRNFFCCVPQRPEDIDVRFIMSTNRWDAFEAHYGDEQLRAAVQRDRRPFVWMIHGFMNNIFIERAHNDTKDAWIKRGFNVIIVDWHLGNRLYLQSMANVRVVGALVGQLMHFLGVTDRSVCAGFSLGSHICGEAGQFIKRRGQVISTCHGIDPAGPGFDGCGTDIRLDPSDCGLVTAIHSSQFVSLSSLLGQQGLGTKYKSGHCDFWMNHGLDQPSCDKATIGTAVLNLFKLNLSQLGKDVEYALSCSHWRGFHYYLAQVRGDCNFQGYEGECGGGTTCVRSDLNSTRFSATESYQAYTSTTERYPEYYSTAGGYSTDSYKSLSGGRRITRKPYLMDDEINSHPRSYSHNDDIPNGRVTPDQRNERLVRGKRDSFSRDRVNHGNDEVPTKIYEETTNSPVTECADDSNGTFCEDRERGIIGNLFKKVVNRFVPGKLGNSSPNRIGYAPIASNGPTDGNQMQPSNGEGNFSPVNHWNHEADGHTYSVMESSGRDPENSGINDQSSFGSNDGPHINGFPNNNGRPVYANSGGNSFNHGRKPGIVLGWNQNEGDSGTRPTSSISANHNFGGNNQKVVGINQSNSSGRKPTSNGFHNNHNWNHNFIEAPLKMRLSPDDICDVSMNVDYKVRTSGTFPYC